MTFLIHVLSCGFSYILFTAICKLVLIRNVLIFCFKIINHFYIFLILRLVLLPFNRESLKTLTVISSRLNKMLFEVFEFMLLLLRIGIYSYVSLVWKLIATSYIRVLHSQFL